jgi:hypothetical protein
MSDDRIIQPYEGVQPNRLAGAEAIVTRLIGSIEAIDGRLMELGCVIVDPEKAPNYITELHWFPVAKASLS